MLCYLFMLFVYLFIFQSCQKKGKQNGGKTKGANVRNFNICHSVARDRLFNLECPPRCHVNVRAGAD